MEKIDFRSKEGLLKLNEFLSSDYELNYNDFIDNLFHKVDVDFINHYINTEINGMEIINRYDEFLNDPRDYIFQQEIDKVQNNHDKMIIVLN